ncbi:MAG: DUF4476 domain-containing protein [Chitinophagaceae bacterium]|nr:DUF4476 domain-containing protein [Chitinophagaceae bacterium]
MKKIFTLLVVSMMSLSLLAYDGSSRLSISAVNNKMNLQVEVDGRKIAMRDNGITLRDIGDGYHNIKIFREVRRNNNGWGNNSRISQQVLYNSRVYLRRGYHLDITVNRFGKVFTDEQPVERFDDEYYGDNDYYEGNSRGNSYTREMNNRDFEQAKETLRKDWFESSRLTTAKTIIDMNYFATAQVIELVQLFSFDDKKLEIAKYAYRKTVDKNNYYLLAEQLTFSSSKDELARFIRESR